VPIPRKELPSVGEYVVATVREIFDYGAYVTLDEYGDLRAYLPWSEVASRWVRSIREVIRENQKIVVKVIRVDHKRKTVDVSLKKVSDSDRRKKMLWWKRYLKASKIAEIVAGKLGKSVEDAYREVVWKLEDYYGDPLLGLEEAILRGGEALSEAGVPSEWHEALIEEAKKHVHVKTAKIRVVLQLRSYAGDGVERIKKVLNTLIETASKHESVKVEAYSQGSPQYIVELIGYDYKELEKLLSEALEAASSVAEKLGVEFKYERVRQ